MRLAKRLAFFRFDFSFGIIKGEQPLIRGSSASKSLVVFWFSFATKREHPSASRTFPAERIQNRPVAGDQPAPTSASPVLLCTSSSCPVRLESRAM